MRYHSSNSDSGDIMMCKIKDLDKTVYDLIDRIIENREYLSRIDGETGDGDHGINMAKGFAMTRERLDKENDDLSDSLFKLSDVLMLEIGGSMGPLYGMFFEGMANACKGAENMDLELFCEMVSQGLDGVLEIGQAKKGDKTLLDTLIPAKESLEKSLQENVPFKKALEDFKQASEKGRDDTIEMVAKVGRASRLGQRSAGHLDAGAASCDLILRSMADSILETL